MIGFQYSNYFHTHLSLFGVIVLFYCRQKFDSNESFDSVNPYFCFPWNLRLTGERNKYQTCIKTFFCIKFTITFIFFMYTFYNVFIMSTSANNATNCDISVQILFLVQWMCSKFLGFNVLSDFSVALNSSDLLHFSNNSDHSSIYLSI